jgi:hypothetical protein
MKGNCERTITTTYPDGERKTSKETFYNITEEECKGKCEGVSGAVSGTIYDCETEWSRK